MKSKERKVFSEIICSVAKKIKRFILGILRQLRDIHNLTLFAIVVIVMTIPIWLLYLLGILFGNTALIAVGTVYWAFWMGPMTPFFPLCVAIALGIRKIIDKYRCKKRLVPLSEVKIAWWENFKTFCKRKFAHQSGVNPTQNKD